MHLYNYAKQVLPVELYEYVVRLFLVLFFHTLSTIAKYKNIQYEYYCI